MWDATHPMKIGDGVVRISEGSILRHNGNDIGDEETRGFDLWETALADIYRKSVHSTGLKAMGKRVSIGRLLPITLLTPRSCPPKIIVLPSPKIAVAASTIAPAFVRSSVPFGHTVDRP